VLDPVARNNGVDAGIRHWVNAVWRDNRGCLGIAHRGDVWIQFVLVGRRGATIFRGVRLIRSDWLSDGIPRGNRVSVADRDDCGEGLEGRKPNGGEKRHHGQPTHKRDTQHRLK
jgi:hypothetical protein